MTPLDGPSAGHLRRMHAKAVIEPTVQVDVVRHEHDLPPRAMNDRVATEEPLELRVEGRPVAVLMRTPGQDDELAAGFLLSEGLIQSRQDVFEVQRCPGTGEHADNVIEVLLTRPDPLRLEALTRHVFSASSCGICGKATIASVHQHFPAITVATPAPPASMLQKIPAALLAHQDAFRATGGLHAAALVRPDGTVLAVREDVGRHNAVDKLLGRCLLDDALPLSAHVLFVSGRISFEIVQKALAARIAIIGGVSAPTSLAVAFAQASGQTLVGFVRDGRLNVYAGTVDSG